nr:hypothetical protein [Trametes versicolor]
MINKHIKIKMQGNINNNPQAMNNNQPPQANFDELSNGLDELRFLNRINNQSMTEYFEERFTTINESFPWLKDDEGNNVPFDKNVSLFEGVKFVSQYLAKKYNMDKDSISEASLSDLLSLYLDGQKEVPLIEWYQHVSSMYYKNANFFKSLKNIGRSLESGQDNVSDTLLDSVSLSYSKPLGEYGEITLNQIMTGVQELDWSSLIPQTEISIHAALVAFSLISYGFMLKNYVRYVHNKPYPNHLIGEALKRERLYRSKQLYTFALIGAPIGVVLLNLAAIPLKDLATIKFTFGNAQEITSGINSTNSAIFIFLSKLSNKIPTPIKVVGKLQLGIFLVMKLLGFSIIDVWTNQEKLKIYIAVLTIFVILCQLLSLFFLFRFSKGKNINCLEILPDFLINWLNDLKEMSLNNEVFKSTKESLYLHIVIYIVVLIFLVLI